MVFQKSEILKNAVSERWCTDSSWKARTVLNACIVLLDQGWVIIKGLVLVGEIVFSKGMARKFLRKSLNVGY